MTTIILFYQFSQDMQAVCENTLCMGPAPVELAQRGRFTRKGPPPFLPAVCENTLCMGPDKAKQPRRNHR